MKILGIDISLLFSIKWEADGGKVNGEAKRRTLEAVTAARQGFDRWFLACDAGPSYRRQIPEYKANREDRGEVYREQLRGLIDRCRADGAAIMVAPQVGTFPLTGAPSFAEADDVMGWAAHAFSEHVGALSVEARAGWRLALLTDDSDIEQVINDDSCVTVIKSALRGGEEWNEARVLEKRGVRPDKIADVKALAGDKSDNYDGFCNEITPDSNPPKRGPGIGPKGAVSLINKYGGALQIFDVDGAGHEKWKADGVPDLACALLAKHGRAQAERGLFLARLAVTLPGLDFAAVLAEPVVQQLAAPEAEEHEKTWPKAPEAIEPTQTKTPAKSTALAAPRVAEIVADVVAVDWSVRLQPTSSEEAFHMAISLHRSKLFEKKFGSPEAIWTVIMIGREHGLSMMAALQSMHLIEGKVEMSAELIVAKILRSGLAHYFTLIQSDDNGATWETHRVGEKDPLRMTFTVAEAERREIFKVVQGRRQTFKGNTSQWQKMPDVMCMWRCATKLGKAKYPDVTRGLVGMGEIRETRHVIDADDEAA